MLFAVWALLEGWAAGRWDNMGRRELIAFVVIAVTFTVAAITVVVLAIWPGVFW